MNNKQVFLLPLAAAISVVLSGCSNIDSVKKLEKDAKKIALKTKSNVDKADKFPSVAPRVVVDEHKRWVPAFEVENKRAEWKYAYLPVSINSEFTDIAEVAQKITSMTGLIVEVSPDVYESATGSSEGAATPVAGTSSPPPDASSVGAAPVASPVPMEGVSEGKKVVYSGNLEGFLDTVSAQFGVNWKKVSDNRIKFFKYETRNFVINGLPGDITQKDTVTGESNESSFQMSGASIWKAIKESVQSVLSMNGKMSIAESTGILTVTDTPQNLERVEKLIYKLNKDLATTVALKVEVYSVEVEDSNEFGLDWAAIYKTLAANAAKGTGVDLGLTVPASGISTNAGQVSLGIIGNSEWNGSKAIIKALAQRGNVAQISTRNILTLNNMPAPFKLGGTVAYVKSAETTVTNGVAQTSVQQDTVKTGYFLNILPHVIDTRKGELVLQVSMSSSSLVKLNTVDLGQTLVQTPETREQTMAQRVRLQSGQTLVISSYDSADISSQLSGMNNPDDQMLGGATVGKKSKTYLVMMVTPIVEKRK